MITIKLLLTFWKLGYELKVIRRLLEPIFNCENIRSFIKERINLYIVKDGSIKL